MAFKFKKLFVKDGDLSRIQDNVDQTFLAVQFLPWMNGVFIDSILLTVGIDNPVNHGLDRTPNGFLVVDSTLPVKVWRQTSKLPDRVLVLRTDTTATVKLWVF